MRLIRGTGKLIAAVLQGIIVVSICYPLMPTRVIAADASSPQEQFDKIIQQIDQLETGLGVLDKAIDRSQFDIDVLAAALGPNIDAIFYFVRDRIRYEPYYGVLRGARGTLLGRAGNALDRSLLLAALLTRAGYKTEIASGDLDETKARSLVDRAFEPTPGAANTFPNIANLDAEVARALNVDAGTLATIGEDLKRNGKIAEEALSHQVDEDTRELVAKLGGAGVTLPGAIPISRLTAEAREHYWVRCLVSDKWIDLDSAFADAKPGQVYASLSGEFSDTAVPPELFHRFSLKVTLRVAEVSNGNDGEFRDILLIDRAFPTADRQDIGVRIANVPFPPLEIFGHLNGSVSGSITKVQGFTTFVHDGKGTLASKYFDLSGKISDAPPGSAGGAGGGFLRGSSALDNLFGGSAGPSGESKTTRIVGQWIDYQLISPNLRGGAPTVRSFRRDIIAPTTVVDWSPDGPAGGIVKPTNLAQQELRTQLLWSAELLPISGDFTADYLAYLELSALKKSRNLIASMTKTLLGLPIDGKPPELPTQPLSILQLALSGIEGLQLRMIGQFSDIRTYTNQPDLIAFERRWRNSTNPVLTEGYDIVSWAPRIMARDGSLAGTGELNAIRGVFQTRLEWELMKSRATPAVSNGGSPATVMNAAEIFRAAKEQGIGTVVLSPGSADLQRLGGLDFSPAIKAELAYSLGIGATLVVPERSVSMAGDTSIGWWRIEPETGLVLGIMPGGRGAAATEEGLLNSLQFQGTLTAVESLSAGFVCMLGTGHPDHWQAKQYVECGIVAVAGGVGAWGSWRGHITLSIAIIATLITMMA